MPSVDKSHVVVKGLDRNGVERDILLENDGSLAVGGKTVLYLPLVAQGSGQLIGAAGAQLKIKVVSLFGTISADGTMKFTSGSGPTNRSGAMTLKAGGGFGMPAGNYPLFETAVNEALQLVMTGGVFDGVLGYITEA